MNVLNHGGGGFVALVPMKPLHLAKSRLSAQLVPSQRAALSIGMLAGVLSAAVESAMSEIWVVGGDDKIRELTRRLGARWIEDTSAGLNDALSDAINAADNAGLHSLYLPGDLPFLRSGDIAALIAASEGGSKLALAAAQRDGGTNAMLVPARSRFRPALGEDSFRRHTDLAQRLGMPYAVCDSPGFALDLDTPADLERCEEIEPGFLGRLAGLPDLPANTTPESIIGLPGDG